MTSNITPITAASKDGDTDKPTENKVTPEHGLAVLRDREGQGLISLACEALYETSNLASEMHARLYPADPADDRELLQLMGEALACLETGQHYLLMLSSIVEERERSRPPDPGVDPWSVEPAF